MTSVKKIVPADNCWLDRRLLNICHCNFAYCTDPASSIDEWRKQRDFTKSQIALSAGLRPAPKSYPLKPTIGHPHKYQGITISAVSFESMPGAEVTGTLYMPERVKNQAPGILCPHGHLERGRLESSPLNNVPLFCLMMARLGFIVFSYDMPGYNGNSKTMHTWPEELQKKASLYGVSPFGIQTYNSLKALDFLCNLPEVDERRIGAVGHGAGAYQAMIATLLDERIKVLAISKILSSHFQGNCQCEEGPLLHINNLTSFDMLSACAPRPLFIASTSLDFTSQTPNYEYPALQKVYKLLDSEDAIFNYHQNAQHGCSRESREHIYPWFTHWLLNQSLRETIAEDELPPIPEEMLASATGDAPSLPKTHQSIMQIAGHLCGNAAPLPQNTAALAMLHKERVSLVGDIINSDQALKNISCRVVDAEWSSNGAVAHGRIFSRRDEGDLIPAIEFTSEQTTSSAPAVLLVSGNGKSDFLPGGNYSTVTDALISAGCHCWSIDLLGSGESADMPERAKRDESMPHFFAFNQSMFSMRTQDILTILQWIRENGATRLSLVSTSTAARQVLCALSQVDDIASAVIDMDGLNDSEESWLAPLDFQPMILKLGGLKGLVAQNNVSSLGLFNPSEEIETYVRGYYEASGNAAKRLAISRDALLRLAMQIILK